MLVQELDHQSRTGEGADHVSDRVDPFAGLLVLQSDVADGVGPVSRADDGVAAAEVAVRQPPPGLARLERIAKGWMSWR